MFDFPIFYNEIRSVSSKSFEFLRSACVDSLPFFRHIFRLLNENDEFVDEKTKISTLVDSSTVHRGFVEIEIPKNSSQTTPSMKLEEIYRREFNERIPWKSHQAENDCLMLLSLIKIYLPDWIDWINENHRKLDEFSFLPTFSSKEKTKIKRKLKF